MRTRPLSLVMPKKVRDSSYHITRNDPIEPNWPKGSWSVYQITGDQIADRIVREKINPKGWYEGKVIARHCWSGYLGMWVTLAEAVKAIEEAEAA